MRAINLLAAVLFAVAAAAQQPSAVPVNAGWNSMPDSLFLEWKLEDDQVKRLRMIEEDYDTERNRVVSDTALPASGRDAALTRLAEERRNEVKGVLQPKHYADWIERTGH